MLAKSYRLTRQADHRKALRYGAVVRYPPLLVRVVQSGRSASRFSFVVSNQVSKRATQRNRLRRQLREVTRAWLPQIRPGYDVVVTVRLGRAEYPTLQLKEALGQCFRRSRLFL